MSKFKGPLTDNVEDVVTDKELLMNIDAFPVKEMDGIFYEVDCQTTRPRQGWLYVFIILSL